MTIPTVHSTMMSDDQLWRQSRAGDREAFGQIVERYQALVCSLAYSACGNLSRSEDLAQETFVTAWQKLGDLREPAKLRAWLCGIVRNLAANTARREQRRGGRAGDDRGRPGRAGGIAGGGDIALAFAGGIARDVPRTDGAFLSPGPVGCGSRGLP